MQEKGDIVRREGTLEHRNLMEYCPFDRIDIAIRQSRFTLLLSLALSFIDDFTAHICPVHTHFDHMSCHCEEGDVKTMCEQSVVTGEQHSQHLTSRLMMKHYASNFFSGAGAHPRYKNGENSHLQVCASKVCGISLPLNVVMLPLTCTVDRVLTKLHMNHYTMYNKYCSSFS